MAADKNKTANPTNKLFLILVVNIINTNLAQTFGSVPSIKFKHKRLICILQAKN